MNTEELKTEPNNKIPTEEQAARYVQSDPRPHREDMMHVVHMLHDERCDSMAALCQTVETMAEETLVLLGYALGTLDAAADAHMAAIGEKVTTTKELAAKRMQFILDMVGPAAQVAVRDRIGGWHG